MLIWHLAWMHSTAQSNASVMIGLVIKHHARNGKMVSKVPSCCEPFKHAFQLIQHHGRQFEHTSLKT
jgi:hypothetical protein